MAGRLMNVDGAGLALAVLFGLSTALAKLALEQVGPLMLAGLLYVGAGAGLALYRLLPLARPETRLGRRDMPWLAGAIVSGGVACPALLAESRMRIGTRTGG